jgi:arsenate reductase
MAEAIMNRKGAPNFAAYSAASEPKGSVHPAALRQLEVAGLPVAELRSKPWDEFARPGAPHMDFVFTVCDNAAKEVMARAAHDRALGHFQIPRRLRAPRNKSKKLSVKPS